MVEDFLALGLEADYPDEFTAEGYLGLRKAREDWYLRALVSGLGLTKSQERQAEEAIGVLRERDFAEFQAYLDELKSFEDEGKPMMVIDGGKARKLMDAEAWLKDGGYVPARLCDLNEDQMAVSWGTWASGFFVTGDSPVKISGQGFPGCMYWKDVGGEPEIILKKFPPGGSARYSKVISYAGVVFPLSKVQIERFQEKQLDESIPPMIEQATILQADQLKILLLLSPEISKQLLTELAK